MGAVEFVKLVMRLSVKDRKLVFEDVRNRQKASRECVDEPQSDQPDPAS